MKFHSASIKEIVIGGVVLSREHCSQGRLHTRIEKNHVNRVYGRRCETAFFYHRAQNLLDLQIRDVPVQIVELLAAGGRPVQILHS